MRMHPSLAHLGHCLETGWRHLVRGRATSLLLALGLGIGVGIVSIVLCAAANMESRLAAGLPRDPDRVLIATIIETQMDGPAPSVSRFGFGRDEILAIAALPDIGAVSAEITGAPVGLSPEASVPSTILALAGADHELADQVSRGSLPVTTIDVSPGSGDTTSLSECAISEALAQKIFGSRESSSPGRGLKVFGRDFTVVGLLGPGSVSVAEYLVVVPASCLPAGGSINQIRIVASSPAATSPVAARIREFVRTHLPAVSEVDISTASDVFERQLARGRRTALMTTALSSAILLLACINTITLSLTRVVERYQEIGLRRVLGATRTEVSLQIILETIVLGAVGGAGGLALALVLAFVLARLGVPLSITTGVVGWAVTVLLAASLAVSLPVGFAVSRVDPRKALGGLE